jgi:hypothetical protein
LLPCLWNLRELRLLDIKVMQPLQQ